MKYYWFIVQFVTEKKSMTVSDNANKAEGLGSFSKNLGRISAKAIKNLATNVLKKPRASFGNRSKCCHRSCK